MAHVDKLTLFGLWLLDHSLHWLLTCPRDFALIILGTLSAAVLLLARAAVGNQDLIRRCKSDRKRINALCKSAKAGQNLEALKRLRKTLGLVALKQLKTETRVMLCAAPVMMLLLAWCSERLQYYPLRAGDAIELVASFPPSSAGELAYLVPDPQLESVNGWIQTIRPGLGNRAAVASANWSLRSKSEGTRPIALRYKDRTLVQPLSTLHSRAELLNPSVADHGCKLQLRLRPVMLFNFVPGIPGWGLPPCVVGSALVCIVIVTITNQLLSLLRKLRK